MKRKRYSVEQIVAAVRQHDLGVSAADIARKLGIAEQTFYRWKKQYGGLEASEGRCQTNWIGPIEASIEGSQAASWRHSARAAVRCCLKTSRRVRWRWWLKWL